MICVSDDVFSSLSNFSLAGPLRNVVAAAAAPKFKETDQGRVAALTPRRGEPQPSLSLPADTTRGKRRSTAAYEVPRVFQYNKIHHGCVGYRVTFGCQKSPPSPASSQVCFIITSHKVSALRRIPLSCGQEQGSKRHIPPSEDPRAFHYNETHHICVIVLSQGTGKLITLYGDSTRGKQPPRSSVRRPKSVSLLRSTPCLCYRR